MLKSPLMSRENEQQLPHQPFKNPSWWITEQIRNSFGSLVYLTDPTITGKQHINNLDSGAFAVVAPHNGNADTALVRMAFPNHLKKKTFVVAAADHWNGSGMRALAGMFARLYFLHRKEPAVASRQLQEVADITKAGQISIIFPEGTRSRDQHAPMKDRPFKYGIGRLVVLTNGEIPVIPIFLRGTADFMPPKKIIPTFREHGIRRKIGIEIGPPTYYSDLIAHTDSDAAAAQITGAVKEYFINQQNPELVGQNLT